MSKRENGVASVAEATEKMELTSAMEILHQWSNSLSNVLKYGESDTGIYIIDSLIAQHTNVAENLQRLILDEMIGRNAAKDKEQFIRMVQMMAAKLLDHLSAYTNTNLNKTASDSVLSFIQVLLKTIHFVQEFFGNYFDKNERVPAALITIYQKEISNLAEKLKQVINSSMLDEAGLSEVINSHFLEPSEGHHHNVSYRLLFYEKELLHELLKERNINSSTIRNLLYYFNFNCSGFVIYEFDRLVNLLTPLSSKSEKINRLRSELKNINQLPVRINYYFDENMPSLKEQVSTWIAEEIKYCEAGSYIQSTNSSGMESENKIHTTLSVAKLGLLVRLLVVDKIIINRTVAPMLRTVAKTFTTLQREEISFGSLETKYHAPDKATIGMMKEILQKWIHILGKL
ncbi:MAG: hypothetical protein J0H85_04625 [Sediminibacterium magnilacihabitans]|jgi:hypothetical protein|nr:hypothetical protein [Sediminibacterium magnilacihabitans]PQV61811.1 hypothetical protein CLV53_10185 [Sediminibacterium magnilacihabitans]